jgi:hypothetical protein
MGSVAKKEINTLQALFDLFYIINDKKLQIMQVDVVFIGRSC